MKTIVCLLFLTFIITLNCSSQDSATDVLQISKLPPEGVLLDKGWKLAVGDDPAYASPGYDDSKWQAVDPTKDIHDIPALWKDRIVWFRLHLKVDNAFIGKLAMMIRQSGASELYLNGKLIHRFGKLSQDVSEVKAFSPLDNPASFPVNNSSEQVLAVRYALQPHIYYSTHWNIDNLGIHIVINTIEKANYQYQQKFYMDQMVLTFRIGIFVILCILYLAFYLFYPTQKVNLLFSIYAFIQVITWSVFIYCERQQYVQHWFLNNNFLLFIQLVGFFFMLTAIYRLLEQRRGWIFYSLYVLGVASIPLGAFVYGWGWLVFGILITNFVNIEITRVTIKAAIAHRKGAWIIAVGGVCFLLFWSIFTLRWRLGYPNDNTSKYTFALAYLSLPIAVSIYLGYDFALIHRSLQQKFTEVETLSKEKQQILSAQNEVLEQEVTQRTTELKQSLQELKSTQALLIQKEKMASLGELTAGIAHEIQNPLNFVNNFSEVNKELIAELKEEIEKGDLVEVKAIANDIEENEQKIIHHGMRAGSIVKGMLQHSRASSGKLELTDINALVNESLKLSYHGMRAKDKEFNAVLRTDIDDCIGKVNVVPEDIIRVLLNLLNNAFYAVDEKKRQLNGMYEPAVSVCTKKLDGKVEIRVIDNGNGIPQNIVDKIFQPFFTTKPTGQGTGLGLSLSYDIIKAHGGELKVETIQGKGSEFVIQLPM